MGKDKRFLDKAYSVKTDAQTRSFYDQWAEVYDEEVAENAYQQPRRCAQALAGLTAPSETTILDVGCGSGLSGIALDVAGFQTIDGCDFSPGMLAKAGKTNVYRRLFETNLNEPPMDAPDGRYDAAACVGVFSFGHVKAEALDDILRVLKPAGALVIGLNDHFYEEGSLTTRLELLESEGLMEILDREHGEHMPGTGLKGWVITARKH
ncbi:class I SAM-dependent DNA methyltransferase [Oricola cellulosilytica]|nr:class I SAM-dependent methyltransferase [Oricola cellulosilytica]